MMHLLRNHYKSILRRLNLSSEQLITLKGELNEQNVCAGDFIEGEKMCPNTVALRVKENIDTFENSKHVRSLLKQYGIGQLELSGIFYVIYDLPSKISKRWFKKSLATFHQAVDELLNK